MIGRYLGGSREPATVEEGNAWPKFAEQPYDGPCPAGGHDAQFVGKGYSKSGQSYETRSVVTVTCQVCP